MTDKHEDGGRAEDLLRAGSWTEPNSPVDLDRLAARVRRRRMIAATGGGILAIVLVGVAGVALRLAGGESPSGDVAGPTASTTGGSGADVVPWTDATPRPSVTVAPTTCDPAVLSLALGQTGAWHGMATQLVVITNDSVARCSVPHDISIRAVADNGEEAAAEASLPPADVTLEPAQRASLLVGARGGCADSTIATKLHITVGDGETTEFDDARIPLSCSHPEIVSLQADAVDPPTQDTRLNARLEVPSVVAAGEVLDFTITLTNRGDQPVEFKDCPAYDIVIKHAGLHETYLLNCAAAGPIPANGSTTFAMQVAVPAHAGGSDELSWALSGYPAVISAPIDVTTR